MAYIQTDRVRDKERANPKFSFLNPSDAYGPFYEWRLSEIKAGRGTAVSAGRVGEASIPQVLEKPKGPSPPPEFHFSARIPNISALDLDVVRLTALFVARRGKSFMTSLSQREMRNFQFDFLRPQHSLYQFFTRLVDQYTELLQVNDPEGTKAEKRRLAELEKNVKNKYHVLDRAKQRAEYLKYQEKEKQQKEEKNEQEKIAYAQIDWHDFVVVETVVFTEADDHTELPPPTSLNDLQSASLEQKAMLSLQPQVRRIEEAMPTDDETANYYNAYPPTAPTPQPAFIPTPPVPAPPVAAPSPSLPPPSPVPSAVTPTLPIAPSIPVANEPVQPTPSPAPSTPNQPPMRIRSDYVPRAQAKRMNANIPTTICPNCRQAIPTAQIEHHMRVELLDPRWKEQRAKADARQATTNLSTNEVFNNLKRLASQRTDVFDPMLTGQATPLDPEEETRRKRQAVGPGVPGQSPGLGGIGGLPPPPLPQGINIEEQIRHIHQKFGQ